MKLVQEIKQGSSKWIKTMGDQYSNFYWQEGYGIFSVSPKDVDTVSKYIKNQHVHHKKLSFKDEYRPRRDGYAKVFKELRYKF